MAFKAASVYGDATFNTTGWTKGLKTLSVSTAAVAAAAAAAMVAAVVKITAETNKFEKGMANVSTLIDDVNVNIKDMGINLLRLDSRLGSAVENTDALYQALSAGVDAADGVEFVADAAIFAAAALTDTATAVDVITTALNAYDLEASQAADVSDIFFTTIKQGKINGEQLSSTIGQSIPLFSSMGVELEQLATGMAAMTKLGISAAESTTQLNAIMNGFLKPSEAMTAQLKSLGFESGAAFIEAEGLTGALAMLEKATGGNKDELAKLLPNVRAVKGAMALTGVGGIEFANILEEMANRTDATVNAFEKQELGFESLKNATSAAMIAIGESFFGTTSLMITDLVRITEGFRDWSLETETIGTGIEALMGTASVLVSALELIGKAVDPLVSDLLIAFTGELREINEIVDMLSDTMAGSLGQSLGVLADLVKSFGSSAVAIFKSIIDSGIVDFIGALGDVFADMLSMGLEAKLVKLQVKIEMMATTFTVVAQIVKPLVTLLTSVASGIAKVSGAAEGFKVLETIGKAFNAIRTGVQIMGEFVDILIGPAIQKASGFIAILFGNIVKGIQFLGTGLVDGIKTFAGFIKGLLTGAESIGFFNKAFESVLGVVYTVIQAFKLVGEAAKLALDPRNWGTGNVLESINKQFDVLTDPKRRASFVSHGSDFMGGLVDGITSTMNEAIDNVTGTYEQLTLVSSEALDEINIISDEKGKEKNEKTKENDDAAIEDKVSYYDQLAELYTDYDEGSFESLTNTYDTQQAQLDDALAKKLISEEQYNKLSASNDRQFLQAKIDKVSEVYGQIASTVSSVFGSITKTTALYFEAEQNKIDVAYSKELAALDNKFEQGLITEDEYNTQKEDLEKTKNKKLNKLKKEQFETDKAFAIAQVWIDTATAIMGFWAAYGGIPIAGPIIAGVLSGVVTGVAIAQSVLIGQQSFVPAAAEGGEVTKSGKIRVDEEGGEIKRFPSGTVIIPHDVSMAVAENAQAGGGVNIYNNFDGATIDSDERMEATIDMMIERMGQQFDFNQGGFFG